MNIKDLKKGSIIEYKNGQAVWIQSEITRTTDNFVWFNGSGVQRIKRTTFENWSELFRIIAA